MTIKKEKLAPTRFAEDIMKLLEEGNETGVRELCTSQKNIFSTVVLAGLERQKRGKLFVKEAMLNAARREVVSLWAKIGYLSDISTIAPLIGLLGTILGMIQSFNAVAAQTVLVKPLLLAGGIAKSMINTAGGLVVAIPAFGFFSYFRVKVQEITSLVETYTDDMIKIMDLEKEKSSSAGRKNDIVNMMKMVEQNKAGRKADGKS
jgi:biopolymer transport protein ExbB